MPVVESEVLNPLDELLQAQGFALIDGGLATELEARGHDLGDPLWSARLLMSDPGAIAAVHRAYLAAGADCIIGASYQASIAGFVRAGASEVRARGLLQASVDIALRARDEFWRAEVGRPGATRAGATPAGRLRPVVAASVGPYGAFLADGSEYDGRYGVSVTALEAFHRERFALLACSGADLLACETIPSALEARVLLDLLDAQPGICAWFSFSCRDGLRISDGTPLAAVAAHLARHPRVVAIGVNCTAPRYVLELIASVREACDKAVVAYPNSGERYDAQNNCWQGERDPREFGHSALAWRRAGASLLGGCCRTGPGHIARMRQALMATNG